ncbi:hypothetical protein OIU84_014827 [Salix udensis]|uniref:Uncharacterized protein n=1 Tax=Salix udensis TaxID=889485 RepID=A0AAD6JCW0_9ROSI|nr:hypothetical protein OIU84_014827 [Salix udensis]
MHPLNLYPVLRTSTTVDSSSPLQPKSQPPLSPPNHSSPPSASKNRGREVKRIQVFWWERRNGSMEGELEIGSGGGVEAEIKIGIRWAAMKLGFFNIHGFVLRRKLESNELEI